jgi:hypothetical protein
MGPFSGGKLIPNHLEEPIPSARAVLAARAVFPVSPFALDQIKSLSSGRTIGSKFAGMFKPRRRLISLHVLLDSRPKYCQVRIAPALLLRSVSAPLEFVADDGWVSLPIWRIPARIYLRAQVGQQFFRCGSQTGVEHCLWQPIRDTSVLFPLF